MEKIKIITDSTCDLPDDIINELGIEMVHLTVNINSKSYKDRLQINLDKLDEIIKETGDFPVTSQVNPDVFNEVYEKYLNKGYKIISIHLSDKLSNTYKYANVSKDILNSKDIHIFDSTAFSMGLGKIVYKAASMVKEGYALEKICETIEKMSSTVDCRVIISDLSNLSRSGKIDKKMISFASLIGLRPVLGLLNGELTIVDKVMGKKKSYEYLVKVIEENIQKDDTIWMIRHGESVLFNQIKDYMEKKKYNYKVCDVGCVVGIYSGYGCVGIFLD